MNPGDPSKQAAPGGDSAALAAGAKKNYQTPYIGLYQPSLPSSLLGWPQNGGQIAGATADPTRQMQYGGIPQYNGQGIPVLQTFPSSFVTFGNQPAAPDRRKTNRTPVACVVCHKAKSTCDRSRPCARCRRLGKSHLCKDRPHRKKGRPRKRHLNNDTEKAKVEKKTRAEPTSSSNNSQKRADFKLSDCYLENARYMGNVSGKSAKSQTTSTTAGRAGTNGVGSGSGEKSVRDTSLTELQSNFAEMANQVNNSLWEEIIGDMSGFIADTKKYERNFGSVLRKIPNVKRIMHPLFCMYLTHMSYYLHSDQFIQLQRRMASSGVLIPNGASCKIRKFDESLISTVDCKAIAPISRLRWCLKHPRPQMESRFSRIDNWPLATIKVNMFSTPDPLTLLVYVSVNEEFERIFGFRQAEMVLMSRRPFYYRLIHPKDWKKQLSLEMSTLLNQRKRFNTLIRCVCKWKEEIVCLETFRYSFDEEDHLNHFTISFTPLPRYMFK